MAKSSLGNDLVKVYRIKAKASKMSAKPEMDSEEEKPIEGDLGTILRQAADLADEGAYDEAMGLIDDAQEMCSEMCGPESESGGEEEYD